MSARLTPYSFLLSIIIIFSCEQETNTKEYKPKKWTPPNGFVPDEQTASKIAEAVLHPIYGDVIFDQVPFQVVLVGDSVWVVKGIQQEVMIGGTAYIEINKRDGEILKVTHGR